MPDDPFSFASVAGSKAGVTILHIRGPLILKHIFAFQPVFRALRPATLIMDLSHCIYIDSAGLGLIMNQFVSSQNDRRRFILTGINYRVQALMEVTRVLDYLETFASTADAEAAATPLTRAI